MVWERGGATARGYNYRWEKARKRFLTQHPLCCMCLGQGRVEPATVVDHKVPHRGDQALFWSPANWQSLCKPHHDAAKQAEEHRGFSSEVGLDGWPLDVKHPANR